MKPEFKKFVLDFLRDGGEGPQAAGFHRLQGDGSKRIFWRVTLSAPSPRFIAMANPPVNETLRRENRAYLEIGNHLLRRGIPVPRICRHDLKHGWFIMTDLGETSLQERVSSVQDPLPIYKKTLELLFRLQLEGAKEFDPGWCCQTERYDRTVMRHYEADYFRDAFLCRYLGLHREWPELEVPFDHLAEAASLAETNVFMHRDFQSRNILVSQGNMGIVDWQGGRLGPLGYDLASLLLDPYTGLSPRQREQAYQEYLNLVKDYNPSWIGSLERCFPYLAIQRNLQILGAFGYLTRIMQKPFFEDFIPAALRTLHELLQRITDPELSPLRDLVSNLGSRERLVDMSSSC
jgi:aminoglycoside/choline kinase family phosphotransferase